MCSVGLTTLIWLVWPFNPAWPSLFCWTPQRIGIKWEKMPGCALGWRHCITFLCFGGTGICPAFHSTDHVVHSPCRRLDEVCIRKYSCSPLRGPSALSCHLPSPALACPWTIALIQGLSSHVYSWLVFVPNPKAMSQIPPKGQRGHIPDMRFMDICCFCLPSLLFLLLITAPNFCLGESEVTSNQE